MKRTEDDLATIQYANELVPWRFVVVDLQQLCKSALAYGHHYESAGCMTYHPART